MGSVKSTCHKHHKGHAEKKATTTQNPCGAGTRRGLHFGSRWCSMWCRIWTDMVMAVGGMMFDVKA